MLEAVSESEVLASNEAFYDAFNSRDMDAMDRLWAKLAPVAARLGAELCEVDALDARGLDAFLIGTDAIVNAAGPFGDTAPALIEAALRARLPYLDVTAEPFVAKEVFERFADPARDAQTIVAPAFAFFGALGDLLVTAALDGHADADRVTLAFALDRWRPTKGTRLAGERRAGRRLVRTGGRVGFCVKSAV